MIRIPAARTVVGTSTDERIALAARFGAPGRQAEGETLLVTYYAVQTFFLLYVPFSKISHYLYYPFTRYYLGKTLGRRGVYPMQRGSA